MWIFYENILNQDRLLWNGFTKSREDVKWYLGLIRILKLQRNTIISTQCDENVVQYSRTMTRNIQFTVSRKKVTTRWTESRNNVEGLAATASRDAKRQRGVFHGKLRTCPRVQSWRMRATMGENPWHSKLPVATPEDLPRICDGLAILGDAVHCETRSSSPRVCSWKN